MADAKPGEFDDLLREDRSFPPTAEFRARATVSSDQIYADRGARPRGVSGRRFAAELGSGPRPWSRCARLAAPARQVVRRRQDQRVRQLSRSARARRPPEQGGPSFWEGEPGDRRTLTYFDLFREVSQFANALKSLGAKKGDRVAIYLPLVPELVIAVLACARIGAVHSVVFGGFSAESLQDRINDASASLLVTGDFGYRRGQAVQLKRVADEALAGTPSITNVVVVARSGAQAPDKLSETSMKPGRDHWYHEVMWKTASARK